MNTGEDRSSGVSLLHHILPDCFVVTKFPRRNKSDREEPFSFSATVERARTMEAIKQNFQSLLPSHATAEMLFCFSPFEKQPENWAQPPPLSHLSSALHLKMSHLRPWFHRGRYAKNSRDSRCNLAPRHETWSNGWYVYLKKHPASALNTSHKERYISYRLRQFYCFRTKLQYVGSDALQFQSSDKFQSAFAPDRWHNRGLKPSFLSELDQSQDRRQVAPGHGRLRVLLA